MDGAPKMDGFDSPAEFVFEGLLSIDGAVEATMLQVCFGHGHFSASDALKKEPKRKIIITPFLRRMLSCNFNEYLGDGIRYLFQGNNLGVYTYQFRGEGDFKRVKEWSAVATYRKSNAVLVEIHGKTHPDIQHLKSGRYDAGFPESDFAVQFVIPSEMLREVLGMNEEGFRYLLEKLSRCEDELA